MLRDPRLQLLSCAANQQEKGDDLPRPGRRPPSTRENFTLLVGRAYKNIHREQSLIAAAADQSERFTRQYSDRSRWRLYSHEPFRDRSIRGGNVIDCKVSGMGKVHNGEIPDGNSVNS